ncbi:Dynein heavy chain 3, axonemal [Fukomys damarensis]|uniref:Dynein heavy chain 3, axonemal n=1 Tax=Fukomys damarensis TaxID=885580 RepID=A0A091CW62_FUKDA|nr:Dynein heavy chain 3, axonemal [Fukomys damarensis]
MPHPQASSCLTWRLQPAAPAVSAGEGDYRHEIPVPPARDRGERAWDETALSTPPSAPPCEQGLGVPGCPIRRLPAVSPGACSPRLQQKFLRGLKSVTSERQPSERSFQTPGKFHCSIRADTLSNMDCSSQKLDKSDSIHHMSHPQTRPELPPLPASVDEEPSELYQTVMSHSFYPPLMQRTSWTQSVPFKEQYHHRGPSDSIANNYSLMAQDLKLKDLIKIYQPVTINTSRDKITRGMPSGTKSSSQRNKKMFSSRVSEDPTRTKMACNVSASSRMKKEVNASLTLPGSRPMSPEQQINVMLQQEMEIESKEKTPSALDLERYCYYLTNGIRKDMIAPEEDGVMVRISKLISNKLLTSPSLERLLVTLVGETENDYYSSLMKSIVDYILMDPMERKRLFIESIPRLFPHRVIRAPVPWHSAYRSAHKWNEEHLHTVNPMMLILKELWFTEFRDFRFVRTAELLAGELPLQPDEYWDVICKHCAEARQILLSKSVPGLGMGLCHGIAKIKNSLQ